MKYLLCAKVGAPFGIKGALHLYPFSGQQDSLLGVKKFYVKRKESFELCPIISIRPHGDHLVVLFKDILTPESASIWTNQELYIDPSDLPQLPKGQYYWHELIGMTVVNLENRNLGVVTECYHSHHDVLKTSIDAHIPFVKDDVIVNVDKKSQKITVDYDWDLDDELDLDAD
jgi:16S rRNA processing protein RimM